MTTLIASGINKVLTFARQSALGTIAGTGTGQNLRRTQSTLNKTKATYASKEIRPSQQHADFRHGVVGVSGTISGELSVGTYQHFIESVCRQNVQAGVVGSALTDVAAAVTTAPYGTFTTVAGNFITQGFKVGMVGRWTGWTTTAVANNSANMIITSLTSLVMTVARLDGSPIVAKIAGDSVTFTEVGKHTFVPLTGQTRDYYTIEHWFADITQSEVFTDCVVTQVDIKLPATGMAGIDTQIKGLNMTPNTSTEYFVSPTAVTLGSTLAAANGVLVLAGQPVALITGMNFSMKGNHTMIGGVVGSDVEPDIFPGDVTVDGQVTVLFQNNTIRDYFLNETEVSLICAFTANNTPTSDFTAFTMPRCKLNGAARDDGEKGLVMTMPFVALENINGGAGTNSMWTTIVVQDSTFA